MGSTRPGDVAIGEGDRDRWTLRFTDRDVEQAFQLAATMRPAELRLSYLGSAALWLAGGLIAPVVTAAPPGLVYVIAGFEIATSLVALGTVGRLRTRNEQDRVGMFLNLLAGVAGLAIAASSGEFDRYGTPTLMIVSVVAFIALRLRFVRSVAVTIGYVLMFVAFWLTFASGPLVLGLFFVAAAAGVASIGTYLLEDAERTLFAQRRLIAALHAQVDRLFHQYLSPSIAATLLESPERAELGGELVEVTVLFADLQGFTSYAERSDPASVVALLNEYFEAAVPAVLDEGGTIIQFPGDAIMVIFNAPVRQADHALRAARSALGLQAACEAIARIADDRPRFRVGVNSGPALVGNIGSRSMHNFTAIGDTTNLAARLQTYAQPGRVVIGERTLELIGPVARVEALGAPALKGRSMPVAVYELLGLGEVEQPPGEP